MARKKKTPAKKAKKAVKKTKKTVVRRKAVDKADTLAPATTESINKASVDKLLDRIRQNLQGRLGDHARPLLAEFSTQLQHRLIEQCRVWANDHTDNNIPILPDHVKWYTKAGDYTIIVLEYKPQVRTLLMPKALMEGCPSKDQAGEGGMKPVGIALALPYVLLTLVFHQSRYAALHVNYRNEPLNVIDDMLYFANLPNVNNGDSKVCMGQMIGESFAAGKTITDQANKVANLFWLSNFNMDYIDYYKSIAGSESKMRTLRTWHDSSVKDPGFVLRVHWKQQNTLRHLVNRYAQESGGGKNGLSTMFQKELERSLQVMMESVAKFFRDSRDAVSMKPDDKALTAAIAERLRAEIQKVVADLEAEKRIVEKERRILEGKAGDDDYGSFDPYGKDPYNNPWRRSW